MGPWFAPVALGLAMYSQGLHVDGKIGVRDRVRAGIIETRGAQGSKTLSISEIALPSVEVHGTFGQDQDLLLRYTPQFLNTYTSNFPGAPANGRPAAWAGWTQLHRGLLTYRIGEEHTLELVSTFNISAGKLDVGNPDALVVDSGFLPGAIGSLVTYINANATFAFKHRFGRSLRLTSLETIGIIQYSVGGAGNFFANMPELRIPNTQGNESQLRLISHNELEWLLDARNSLSVHADFSNVSYRSTASFPGVSIGGAYNMLRAGPMQLRAHAGVLRYWTNPFPGIFEKPRLLPMADVTLSYTFGAWHLPHLKANVLAGLAPFYNLQFSTIEPRTTILAQLQYELSRSFSVNGSFRLLSSVNWDPLRHGHPRNIMLVNGGFRYNYKTYVQVDLSAYVSGQTFQPSSTVGYTQLRQAYVLLGLQGTWQKK